MFETSVFWLGVATGAVLGGLLAVMILTVCKGKKDPPDPPDTDRVDHNSAASSEMSRKCDQLLLEIQRSKNKVQDWMENNLK